LAMAEHALAGAGHLPMVKQLSVVRQARRAAQLARLSPAERITTLGTLFEQADMDQLVTADISARWRAQDWNQRLPDTEAAPSRLRQLMNYRLGYSLPEDMLVKVDRLSMAASLEVRAPMLDPDLAALAMRLPDDLLIQHGSTKYILRQAVRDWLPEEVFNHPKTGFSIPLHMFQNRQYQQLCDELLLDGSQPVVRQLFRNDLLQVWVKRGLERHTDAADVSVYRATHQLWALLQLAAWATYFNVGL
jgi:asparagine synthase (glutamine-hydrolysing)